MKKIIPVLLIILLAFSCQNEKPKLSFEHLKSEKRIYASNDSTMPYMRLHLELTYPATFTNDTLLENMQKIFVYAFAGEDYAGKSPKGAFESYEKDMTDEALILASELGKDIPDFSEYYQTVKTAIIDTVGTIITAKSERESYMGGAHGSYNLIYYNIDLTTGKLLQEANFFKPNSTEKLSQLIKEALLNKYSETAGQTFFQIDEIIPNGNFYFTKEGVVYVFNEYEIAPYSEGLIEVLIPFNKIEELINTQYIKEIIG